MEVDELLRRCGGVANRATLLRHCPRNEVDTALLRGRVVAVARGRYALPFVPADLRTAHALSGVLSWTSAALQHGWPVLRLPEAPHVTVPPGRNVGPRAAGVVLHRARLHPDDVTGGCTSPERTLLDCLKGLPWPDALAVADSALRAGHTVGRLVAVAGQATGPGARQARRVAREANGLAANPFESGLRAAALEVPGLSMRPQVMLHGPGGEFLGRPDLVDPELGIVAEADSFTWHGSRSALVRDARRYNAMAVAGFLVLRFTWEDVVLEPDRVAAVLAAAVERRHLSRRRRENPPGNAKGVVRLRGTG